MRRVAGHATSPAGHHVAAIDRKSWRVISTGSSIVGPRPIVAGSAGRSITAQRPGRDKMAQATAVGAICNQQTRDL
jgi:hypothetical protein